jgi:hypothetical protein
MLRRAAEPVAGGLCIGENGSALPVDREARALLQGAAVSAAALPDYVARRARDSGAALPIAWAMLQAQREGASLGALLSLLPAELPHESTLHLAKLLRLDVVAQSGTADVKLGRGVYAQCAPLLDLHAPAPLRSRLLRGLVELGQGAPMPLRLDMFSFSAASLFSAAGTAGALLDSDPPLDALVDTILRGEDADSVNAGRAAPFAQLAFHHAYLSGALLARNPEWWPEFYRELNSSHGGEDFAPLPTVLAGLSEQPRPLPALSADLLELARSRNVLTRQAALLVLANWPEPEPDMLCTLAAAVRDPEPAVRTALAAALAVARHDVDALLRRLFDDSEAAVRTAAAWSCAARDRVDDSQVKALLCELRWGNGAVRQAAAMAAACLGAQAPAIGELLLDAIQGFVPKQGEEWQGLERFSSPVFALALWATAKDNAARLYQGAVEDNGWLLALGLVLTCDWHAVPAAPSELREPLRSRSLSRLGAELEIQRLTAAAVLGRHDTPDSKLLDTLLGFGKPTKDMLQILEVLASERQGAPPRSVQPLLDTLFAPASSAPGVLSEDDPESAAAIDATLTCLGAWAPPDDPELLRTLSARASQSDAAYAALANLVARSPVLLD